MVGFNLDIPEELHTKFKIQSITEGRTMEEVLTTALIQYLKKKTETR